MIFSLFILMVVFAIIPVIGTLISMLLFVPLFAGLFVGAENVTKGEKLQFADLFAGYQACGLRLMGFSIVYTIMYMLAFTLPFLAIGGVEMLAALGTGDPTEAALNSPDFAATLGLSMLVAFSLSLLVLMAYWFAIPLMVFQNKGIFASMGASFKGCLKNIWPLFIYGLLIMIWSLVAIIPVGLGYLIFMPVMFLSMYTG